MAYARNSVDKTNLSIVDYFSSNGGSRCGYCVSVGTGISHGMWAYEMTVKDYQALIDRGWRRCGHYLYKPSLKETCCALYTIKCGALDIKLSKSQKKIIKKMNRFIANDERFHSKNDGETQSSQEGNMCRNELSFESLHREPMIQSDISIQSVIADSCTSSAGKSHVQEGSSVSLKKDEVDTTGPCNVTVEAGEQEKAKITEKKAYKPGVGADAGRPPCKKAKLIRLEKRKQRLGQCGDSPKQNQQKPKQQEKSLEEFLQEPDTPKHRLRIELVAVTGHDFQATFKESSELFAKYQKSVHHEKDSDCGPETYSDFLESSPLKAWHPDGGKGPPQGYGSFHQQYWLDDKLIAVGVLDILPACVSSVYFFYDPDYGDLTLGTYGALREVSFVRELQKDAPDLQWYYMGFYIHTCPKMRYKAGFSPSYLLCPEVYNWHPVEKCLPLLDKSKYSRFERDPEQKDVDGDVDLDKVAVLWKKTILSFKIYKLKNPRVSSALVEKIREYTSLVGKKCAENMLLLLT